MFHPNGPYFLRSCITAWKKHNPNKSFLNSTGILQFIKKSSLLMGSVRNEPYRLALSPLGGSLVILIPACRIAVGNCGLGYEVSQSLKSAWVTLGSGESSSQIFSSVDIQLTARWQFYRTTHRPCSTPSLIIF